MRAADPWSPERVAILEQLWAAGASAQAIARQLGGVSRSAVMGKIFRLGAQRGKTAAIEPPPLADTGACQPSPDRQPTQPDLAPAASLALPSVERDDSRSSAKPARARRKRDDSPPGAAPVRARGKGLLALTNKSCRWPHGTPGSPRFHFCGAAGADLENGVPYCAAHMRRAYLKHPRLANRADLPAVGQFAARCK